MKNTAAALKSHYQEEVVTTCGCWKLERVDGTVLGFTEHPEALTIDGLNYQAESGFTRTAMENRLGLGADNMNLRGLIDSAAITEADIRAGLYRGAQVWFFEVNYTNVAAGKRLLDYGVIGRITSKGDLFDAEFRSLTGLLDQEIGGTYGRYCPHALGDSSCGIVLEPAAWAASAAVSALDACSPTTYNGYRFVCTTAGVTGGTEPTWDTTPGNTTADGTAEWTCYPAYTVQGSVTAASDRQTFVDSGRTEADGTFRFGKLTFTSGLNNGLSMDVKTSQADGTLVLKFPMPWVIAASDTYKVHWGCNKLLRMPGDTWGTAYTGDCRAKWNPEGGGNAVHFGGHPEIPGTDRAARIVPA
jgi:hypothetical protein